MLRKSNKLQQIGLLIVCLCLVLLVPASAMAAGEMYTVYIGGVALSVEDDGNAAYLKNDGTTGAENDYNAKLWYDIQSSALILEINNLAEETASDAANAASYKGAGLYCASPLTLIVKGDNTIHSEAVSNSTVYGMYVHHLTVSEESSGKLSVTTADIKGSCYGIYSTGNVTALGGTLAVTAGSSVNISSGWSQVSYGIYTAGAVTIGGEGLTPSVLAVAGDSYSESCGIFGYAGITVKSGNTQAAGSFAQSGFADGMLANNAVISVAGGTVTAYSIKASGGMTTGICANELQISGGTVTAAGGTALNGEQQSAGVYVNYDIDISGGTVTATGGEALGDVSFGINSWRGDITISGDSVVRAEGGTASYSVGLSAERRNKYGGDLTIQDQARVYASTVNTDTIRVYSYGIFVGGNFSVSGNPYVESVAGRVGNMNITLSIREKRSFGIYLGDDIYDSPYDTNYVEGGYTNTAETHTITLTGGTVVARTLDSDNGIKASEGNQQLMNRSYAVVLYDARQIDFADSVQQNEQWYEWKTDAQDAFVRSTDTAYPYASDWQTPTQYFHIQPLSPIKEPVYKRVIFRVFNGTWADGSIEDITVTLSLKDGNGEYDENGSASLVGKIPTGMLPFEGYRDGSWDSIPPETVSGTQDDIYSYTFITDAPSIPPTGDNSHVALWAALAALSGGCLFVYVLLQHKTKKRFTDKK